MAARNPEHEYIVGVDVGQCASESTLTVFDVTEKQVVSIASAHSWVELAAKAQEWRASSVDVLAHGAGQVVADYLKARGLPARTFS
jgi:hypothetical protein